MSKRIETATEDFRQHLLDGGILDPEGVHHEFVSGLHGRKLDFDIIPERSQLFGEWVMVAAQKIEELYPDIDRGRLALLSVANGTNRLVGPVAERLGSNVTALKTEKVSPKAVKLTAKDRQRLVKLKPTLVVAIEDVGTRGTTSATAILSAREAGAKRVEALNTWQRREQLEELEAIGAVYNSIIYEPLPSLSPEECRATGYCAQGWEFIPHA